VEPARQSADFCLGQIGKRRHGPLAGPDDGFDTNGIESAKVWIIDERRRPIAPARILTMTSCAGAVEIAPCLRRIAGTEPF
jgi:hypothetical protein